MLIRPVVLSPSPSIVVLALGGLVGTLLALGILYGAPVSGLPALEVLGAIGAVLATSPGGALAVGTIVVLIWNAVVLPMIGAGLWTILPGREGTFAAIAIKGAAVGATHWLTLGLLLGLASLLADAPAGTAAGPFGLAGDIPGFLLFAVASLAYGLAMAGVSFLEQGLAALDTVGWSGFSHAATGPMDLGIHRSAEPLVPSSGEKPWRQG